VPQRLRAIEADITRLEVDAIADAVNASTLGPHRSELARA